MSTEKGSLFYPSKDLLEEVKKYEKIFQKIHGESLDRGQDPIEKINLEGK